MSLGAVTVFLKSPFLSKINWTQVLGAVSMAAVYFGFPFPAELQAALLVVLGGITQVATIVIKTYFTPSVTPQSVGK